MYEKLLPLGSVVLVKGGTKRVMITGRVQVKKGDSKIYDYSACLYPEGIVNPQHMYFFDHSSIERLYFVGFQDEEELAFRVERLGSLGELYVDESGAIRQREEDVPV